MGLSGLVINCGGHALDDGNQSAAGTGAGGAHSAGAAGSAAGAGAAGGNGTSGASTLPDGCTAFCRAQRVVCGESPAEGGCDQECVDAFQLALDRCLPKTLALLACMTKGLETPHISCSAAQMSGNCQQQGEDWGTCVSAGP